jgi:TetR/AcrR family transcriptional regulator, tetracycline repressor protein
MRDKNREQQRLDRLEQKRQEVNRRIDERRDMINRQFDRREAELRKGLNEKQEQIIAAALRVLDAEGLNSLSLRKLATYLDMQAPALYWHFKNKDLLIDYLAEAILKEEFTELKPREADEPWQEWFITMCQRMRKAMLSHRDGARIVAGAKLYPAVTLAQFMEVCQESLISAGLSEERGRLIIGTAIHFTFGRVIEEQSSPTNEELENFDFKRFFGQYPRLARNVELMLDDMQAGRDHFDESLRLIVGNA